MSYITPQNQYYEGDKASPLDTDVPKRPSPMHAWIAGAWVADRAQFELAAKIRAATTLEANLAALSSMLGVPGRTSADYAAISAFQTAVLNIPLTTNLASASDEASAYGVMLAAYNVARSAPALTPALKAEFAGFIKFRKLMLGVAS